MADLIFIVHSLQTHSYDVSRKYQTYAHNELLLLSFSENGSMFI